MVFNLFYQATPSIHICSHTRYRLGQCRKYVVIFCFFYRGYEIRRKLDLNSNILFFTLLIIFVSAIFLSALLAYSKSECGRDNLLRTLTYSFKSSSYLKNASHRKRIGSTRKKIFRLVTSEGSLKQKLTLVIVVQVLTIMNPGLILASLLVRLVTLHVLSTYIFLYTLYPLHG